jgi:hypothetical protein
MILVKIDDVPPPTNKLTSILGRKLKDKRVRQSPSGSEIGVTTMRSRGNMRTVSDPFPGSIDGKLYAWESHSPSTSGQDTPSTAYELPLSEVAPKQRKRGSSRRTVSAHELPSISEQIATANIGPAPAAPAELSSGSKRSGFNLLRTSLGAHAPPRMSEQRIPAKSLNVAPVELPSRDEKPTSKSLRRKFGLHELPGASEPASRGPSASRPTASVEQSCQYPSYTRSSKVNRADRKEAVSHDEQLYAQADLSNINDANHRSWRRRQTLPSYEDRLSATTRLHAQGSMAVVTSDCPSMETPGGSNEERHQREVDRAKRRESKTQRQHFARSTSSSAQQTEKGQDRPWSTQGYVSHAATTVPVPQYGNELASDAIRAQVVSRLKNLDDEAEVHIKTVFRDRPRVMELPSTNAYLSKATVEDVSRSHATYKQTLPANASVTRTPSTDDEDDLYSAPPRPPAPRNHLSSPITSTSSSVLNDPHSPVLQEQRRAQHTAIYPSSLNIPLTGRLRGVPSNISILSDDQSIGYNASTLSAETDHIDYGFEERQRERARRMPSAIWSDAQQSSASDYTQLGRRNVW